jgi:predicted patatin/cPLA2 family phospholipase
LEKTEEYEAVVNQARVGGGMSGVAGAGAMIALEDLGFAHAFDAIYTYSAGFANASYLLGEETRLGTSIYYEDLIGKKFINPWRFWRVMDVGYSTNVMRQTKALPVASIMRATTQLYVRLWNVDARRTEYIEAHRFPGEQYLQLMAAASTRRYLSIGPVRLGASRYEDYDDSRDVPEHLGFAMDTDATDILVIYNRPDQRPKDIQPSTRLCEITPDVWVRPSCTDSAKLIAAYSSMEKIVGSLFSQ